MQRLQMFTPYELKLLVCGEQTPTWTREDIVNFTEPKFGYTKDRLVGFLIAH
jgi:E3 ubiquitin-protein ligase HECTD1